MRHIEAHVVGEQPVDEQQQALITGALNAGIELGLDPEGSGESLKDVVEGGKCQQAQSGWC